MPILKRLQAAASLFLAACSFACVFSSGALAQELPAPVADAFKRAGIPATAVGLYAQEVGSGKMLALFNSATPFNPASTMKLVTSNAALELLGPTFTWKTQAYAGGA